MNKKLASFTILEMTIVMLISILIISMAYLIFNIANKQFNGYMQSTRNFNDYLDFDRLLSKDIFHSSGINRYENTVELIVEKKNIRYVFTKDFIVRNDNIVDTFRVGVLSSYFHSANEYVADSDSSIDKINLKLLVNSSDTINVFYRKKYDVYYSLKNLK